MQLVTSRTCIWYDLYSVALYPRRRPPPWHMHCVFIQDFKFQVWRRLHCKQRVNRVKITRNCNIWINNKFWKETLDDFQQPQRQTLQDWSLVVYCWARQTEPTVKVTKHDIREWRKPFRFKWPFLELQNLESHSLQLKHRRTIKTYHKQNVVDKPSNTCWMRSIQGMPVHWKSGDKNKSYQDNASIPKILIIQWNQVFEMSKMSRWLCPE